MLEKMQEIDYTKHNIKELFEQYRICVVIPTYNNHKTLKNVLDNVLKYTSHIIIVNDGSTDTTKTILESYETEYNSNFKIINFEQNKGKGYAIRTALKQANLLGYRYAITIDSDGQHNPDDIPLFLQKIAEEPDAIILGSRKLVQPNKPAKNTFANRFSNFWFWVETGQKIPDTQTGYRVYPLHLLKNKRFLTRRFEFETEVLVRAAWSKIKIVSIPVNVYYPPKGERISHFRPTIDFFKISLLHILLVLIALLYIKPLGFIRVLNRKNIREFFQKQFVQNKEKDSKIVFSVMIGIFSGIIPLWGWQMGFALLLAVIFKLNKAITLVASNISVPPMIPVIIYLSYLLGGLIYTDNAVEVQYSSSLTLKSIQINLIQYLIGSIVLAILLALLAGFITYIFLKIVRKKKAVA